METIILPTNLNCGSCVSKVAPLLNAEPGIHHWAVDTANPAKPLTVHGDVTPTRVAELVAQSGFRVLELPIAPSTQEHEHHLPPTTTAPAEPVQSWLVTYKPLLLVVGFLLGGVLLREAVADRWQLMPMMENFMGGFFVVFSLFKLLDLSGFAQSYRSYDLLARQWPTWGYLYPFVELALGILFLTGLWPIATNGATLLLMLLGLAGVWNSLRQKRTIQCACLGTVFNLPMSTVTLVEDGGMALMAAAMLATLI